MTNRPFESLGSHGKAQASLRSVIKNAWRETDRFAEKRVHYLLDLVGILKVPMIKAMKGAELAQRRR